MHIPYLVPLLASVAAATSPYRPSTTACPTTGPLIRDGNTDLGTKEAAYLAERKVKADASLRTWLDRQSAGLGSNSTTMPTLALSISGGGWRSLVTGAGVMQAMDERDSAVATSGLLQAMCYHIGVSGGAWLVASWSGNNFPTISALKEELWLEALWRGLQTPGGWGVLASYANIAADVIEKGQAGYPISLTDVWSRLLSYQFLNGKDGGVATRFSDVAGFSNMTEFKAPIPIINMNGVDTTAGDCNPQVNGTVWEANPFEFGSWDEHVSAWIPIEHMGTSPNSTECTVGFDNLGHILGMASSLFGMKACLPDDPLKEMSPMIGKLVEWIHDLSSDTMFGRVPNTFQGHGGDGVETAEVFVNDELYMVDGGIVTHNDPIAPLLEPARDVSVILLSDNSADDAENFATGLDMVDARDYVRNISRISSRMPTIPDEIVFASQNLTKRGVFFGCDEPEAVTIVWLPNVNYTYASGMSTNKFQYDKKVTEGMIANGMAVATQQGDAGWGLCLACAIMQKEADVTLPDGCDACFDQWCYREPSVVAVTTTNETAARVRRDVRTSKLDIAKLP